MFLATMIAYPTDLPHEGHGTILDRMQGELGLSGLAAWALSPPRLEPRPGETEPRIWSTRGGMFFQPDQACYESTRCKPMVADVAKGKNPLRWVSEACAARQWPLRVLVSAGAGGGMAHRHPEAACRNALGAASEVNVCLTNPDVQAFLVGTLTDLARHYAVAEMVITDFESVWGEAESAAPSSATIRHLLSHCFCPSCRQRAESDGFDLGSVRAQVARRVGELLDSWEEPAPSERALPRAYLEWRVKSRAELWTRLARSVETPLMLDRGRHGDADAGVGEGCPAIVHMTSGESPASIKGHPMALTEAVLDAGLLGGDESGIVSLVSRAAEAGLRGVLVDHWGRLPERAVAALKGAVRFARRLRS